MFGVGWLSSSSALPVVWCVRGFPSGATGSTMQWMRWSFQCVTGHTTVCFMHQEKNIDKCRGNSAVFSGWRARCVRGACEVSITSCSSATSDRFFEITVVDGIVKISRRRIFFGIARMVKRQVQLVLAPLRALRSHRRVFARVI